MKKCSKGGGVKSGMNPKATVVKKASPANKSMNAGKAKVMK